MVVSAFVPHLAKTPSPWNLPGLTLAERLTRLFAREEPLNN
jgi:hypothetical protein